MKKYNIKELEEKLKRCKDIDLSEINIDEIDDLNEIRISRRKSFRSSDFYAIWCI